MNFLTAYSYYLFRREAAILMTFRQKGRTRRLVIPAYWRATLLPMVLPLGFGLGLLFNASIFMAWMCSVSMLLGVLAGELVLFQQSKMAWPVFERVLHWKRLLDFHERQIGPVSLPTPNAAMSSASASVPLQVRRMILKGYVAARRNPPTFAAWLPRSPELRTTVVLIAIMVGLSALEFLTDPDGFWLIGPVFLIGLQLRRAKMAVDFILTWPLMEKFIDWQAVYRDSGTVEEVEF